MRLSSDRPDPVLISELRESVARIGSYLAGHSAESFRSEARLPHLNWGGMAGLRHMLAHDYGAASPSLLWSIATVSVPQLANALSQLPED